MLITSAGGATTVAGGIVPATTVAGGIVPDEKVKNKFNYRTRGWPVGKSTVRYEQASILSLRGRSVCSIHSAISSSSEYASFSSSPSSSAASFSLSPSPSLPQSLVKTELKPERSDAIAAAIAAADAANVAATIANSLLYDLTNEPDGAIERLRRKRKLATVPVECDLTGDEETWSAHAALTSTPRVEARQSFPRLEIDQSASSSPAESLQSRSQYIINLCI
jgi:hypothetical protein